jgi:hypothetical protein
MEHYGKSAELAWMMQRWVEAIRRRSEFRQQIDPRTGDFTRPDPGGYSPAALVFLDYLWRLSGPRQEGSRLEWNLRPPAGGKAVFRLTAFHTHAILTYNPAAAVLEIGGKTIATVSGTVRLVTNTRGGLEEAKGIASETIQVSIVQPDRAERKFTIAPNQRVLFT